MIIYPQEICDGLAESIKANATMRINSEIRLVEKFDNANLLKALAAIGRKPESDQLFYLENIVATAGWNKNDDIHDKKEMWNARFSCADKPLNLEHNDKMIIGHTISSIAVDADYNDISNIDLENLPDFYHILAGDVIYKVWHEASFEESIKQLIQDIKDGLWSVSMECTMKGFDYGLTNGSESFIVERNADTSYMTQSLRLFGGTGEFNGYKIGRLMRGIEFCGKGLVKQPANPYSIIFNNFGSLAKKVVYNLNDNNISNGDIFMSDELKNELKATSADNTILRKDLAVAEVKLAASAEQLSILGSKVNSLGDENKSLASDLSNYKTKVSELEAKLAEMGKARDALVGENSKLSTALEAVQKDVRIQARINDLTSKLNDVNVEKASEIASAFVEKHADKSDELFNELVELFVAAKAVPKPKKSECSKAPKVGQCTTIQKANDLLENADVSVVDDESHAAESDNEEIDEDLFVEASLAFAHELSLSNRKLFKNIKKQEIK